MRRMAPDLLTTSCGWTDSRRGATDGPCEVSGATIPPPMTPGIDVTAVASVDDEVVERVGVTVIKTVLVGDECVVSEDDRVVEIETIDVTRVVRVVAVGVSGVKELVEVVVGLPVNGVLGKTKSRAGVSGVLGVNIRDPVSGVFGSRRSRSPVLLPSSSWRLEIRMGAGAALRLRCKSPTIISGFYRL